MIYREGNKELIEKRKMIYPGRWMVATKIYHGAQLVWTAVKSCFGAGFWDNDKPWRNDEGWKN